MKRNDLDAVLAPFKHLVINISGSSTNNPNISGYCIDLDPCIEKWQLKEIEVAFQNTNIPVYLNVYSNPVGNTGISINDGNFV